MRAARRCGDDRESIHIDGGDAHDLQVGIAEQRGGPTDDSSAEPLGRRARPAVVGHVHRSMATGTRLQAPRGGRESVQSGSLTVCD